MADTLGVHNPLRFRGYVYDQETSLYYLQSRYYDPNMGRFLNADAFASTGQGLVGDNVFVYCLNNPVNRIDEFGAASIWAHLRKSHDMGYVHRLVTNDIKKNYDAETEVVLNVYGRADVLRKGLVWEVKHVGYNPPARMIEAFAQAFVYRMFNPEVRGLGEANAFSGTVPFDYGGEGFVVTYSTPAPGVILYWVRNRNKPKPDYLYDTQPDYQRRLQGKPTRSMQFRSANYLPNYGTGFYCSVGVIAGGAIIGCLYVTDRRLI